MASILRRNLSPVEAKSTLYKSNGTGRDGYIVCNSGGFIKTTLPPLASPKMTKMPSKGRSTRARLDGKAVFYHSDGTGRDNYIVANAGGFLKGNGEPALTFQSTLRTYEKSRSPTHYGEFDYFTWAQQQRSSTDNLLDQSKNSAVKELVMRLTLPSPGRNKNLSPLSPLNNRSLIKLQTEGDSELLKPSHKHKSSLIGRTSPKLF